MKRRKREPTGSPPKSFPEEEEAPLESRWGWYLCAFAAVAAYVTAFPGGFVFDDVVAVVGNQDVTGTTPISSLLTNDYWGTPVSSPQSHKSYRPLTVLLFRSTHAVCGLSPSCFIAVNVILHLTATMLVYTIAQGVTRGAVPAPFITALLFALHPVHTEAVASVVGQAEVLCAVLSLAGVALSLRGHTTAGVLCAAVGGFAKETGITVAALLVVAGRGAGWWGVGGFLALRYWVTGGRVVVDNFRRVDNPLPFIEHPATRMVYMVRVWLEYARLLLIPYPLSCDYSFAAIPVPDPLPVAAGAVAVVLGAGILLWRAPPSLRPAFLCALVFAAATFLPASHLLFYPGTLVAERLLYLPSAGVCLIFGIAALGLPRRPRTAVVCLVGVLFAGVTLWRNPDWHSQQSLFEAALRVTPDSNKVQLNMAVVQYQAGHHDRALDHLSRARAIAPEACQVEYWEGRVFLDRGDIPNAVQRFQKALLCRERDHDKYAKEALLNIFKEVVRRSPTDPDAHGNLANMYALVSDMKRAEVHYEKSLKIRPLPAVMLNYARLKLATGDRAGALTLAKKAAEGDPALAADLLSELSHL
eukprot:Sspe_Gene.14590::Locus_5049_Transcript_2_2_Confidence_0.833_Length_1807::g.14590::m.14590